MKNRLTPIKEDTMHAIAERLANALQGLLADVGGGERSFWNAANEAKDALRQWETVKQGEPDVCPKCGGSGGGSDPAIRCLACSGTGQRRTEAEQILACMDAKFQDDCNKNKDYGDIPGERT